MNRFLIIFSLFIVHSLVYAAEFNWSYELGSSKNSKCLSVIKDKRFKEAISPCSKDAKNGDSQAQYNLAVLYFKGLGTKQDYKSSFAWLSKSTSNDYLPAFNMLGYHYEKGIGVEQDLKKAAHWYKKSAKKAMLKANIIWGVSMKEV